MSSGRRMVWTLLLVAVLSVGGAAAAFWVEGYRVYVIHTGSMSPTDRPGDVVIDRAPHGDYRPGQVITFRHSDAATDVVTHRITDITATGLIHTKGDANASGDVWDIRPNQVKGVATYTVPRLGYLLVFLKQASGIGAVIAGILALSLLWGLFFPEEDGRKVRSPAHAYRKVAAHRAQPRHRATAPRLDSMPEQLPERIPILDRVDRGIDSLQRLLEEARV